MIEIKIGNNEDKQRLDRFLRKYFKKASLSYIYKIIRKDVKVNGKRKKPETILNSGDIVKLYIPEELGEEFISKNKIESVKKSFKISYEDENLLIVYKPWGLLTHGTKEEKKNHLTNQVITYLIETGEFNPRNSMTFSPSPVNRLDRNTVGLVAFAKNSHALQNLNEMMRKNLIKKYYIAIVKGEIRKPLYLNGNIQKKESKNKMEILKSVTENSKEIETNVFPICAKNGYSLVKVELVTGRTHQIRAHLSSVGYPIIGDSKYGDNLTNKKLSEILNGQNQILNAYILNISKSFDNLAYLEGKTFIGFIEPKIRNVIIELFGEELLNEIEGN